MILAAMLAVSAFAGCGSSSDKGSTGGSASQGGSESSSGITGAELLKNGVTDPKYGSGELEKMLKKRPFEFPTDRSIRVITDTDCYCECDDQYCVTHMLMTPRFDMKGVIAEQYGTREGNDSEQKSYEEIQNLVHLMGMDGEINILHGAPGALPDEHTPVDSEGARFIIEEAMKDDPRPLFVCNQGAATNIASAYLMEPKIAEKITVIWIGGGVYPKGGWEFNQNNDINAARVLFKSNMELWQVPMNVYSTMKVSFFELMEKVYPCGDIGKYLVENTMRVGRKFTERGLLHRRPGQTAGEAATSFGGELWSLGDSPCVGLMLNNTMGKFHVTDAPCDLTDEGCYDLSRPGSRKIRVYDTIDSHFILNDMFEKLKFYFG